MITNQITKPILSKKTIEELITPNVFALFMLGDFHTMLSIKYNTLKKEYYVSFLSLRENPNADIPYMSVFCYGYNDNDIDRYFDTENMKKWEIDEIDENDIYDKFVEDSSYGNNHYSDLIDKLSFYARQNAKGLTV